MSMMTSAVFAGSRAPSNGQGYGSAGTNFMAMLPLREFSGPQLREFSGPHPRKRSVSSRRREPLAGDSELGGHVGGGACGGARSDQDRERQRVGGGVPEIVAGRDADRLQRRS